MSQVLVGRSSRRTIRLVVPLVLALVTFAAPPASAAMIPTATTGNATDITATSATLNGTVTSDGSVPSTGYQFEYSTNAMFTSSVVKTGKKNVGSDTTAVSASIPTSDPPGVPLTPDTTYYFRIVVQGESASCTGGVCGTGETKQFKTLPASTGPTVLTQAANPVNSTSAFLNGTITPGTSGVAYHFEYGTTSLMDKSAPVPDATLAAGSTAQPVSQPIIGLVPGTTYYFRLVATATTGCGTPCAPVSGAMQSFVTRSRATVVTQAATDVTATTATLNGSLNPGTTTVRYRFNYAAGTGAAPTTGTPDVLVAGDGVTRPAATTLTGLTPSTTYQFVLTAQNVDCSCEQVDGAVLSFTTAAAPTQPPDVATSDPTNVTTTGGTLNGTVNTKGLAGSYRFDYGTTPNLGSSTTTTPLAASATAQAVSATLSGLAQASTYYYRLVANTAAGTVQTGLALLNTKAPPPPTSTDPVITIDAPSVVEGAIKVTKTGQNEYVCKQVYDRNSGQNVQKCDFTGPEILSRTRQARDLVFTLTADRSPTTPIVVRLSVTGGTAVAVGADERLSVRTDEKKTSLGAGDYVANYGAGTPAVVFAPGQRSAVAKFTVMGDGDAEPNDTMVVSGTVVSGAATVKGTGTGTILNDDGGSAPNLVPQQLDGTPRVTLGQAGALEDRADGQISVLRFPVSLSFPSKVKQTVNLTLQHVTTSPDDLLALPTMSVSFEPGETRKVFELQPKPDDDVEPDEVLLLVSGGTVAQGYIVNDDPQPTKQDIQNQKDRTEILKSLYQDANATQYQYDTDGNGTWDTKCSTPTAAVSYPAGGKVQPSLRALMGPGAAVLRADDSGPITYKYAVRAVTDDAQGNTIPLGPVTTDSVTLDPIKVDKAYVLAQLAETRRLLVARLAIVRKQKTRPAPRSLPARGLRAATPTSSATPAAATQIQQAIKTVDQASSQVKSPSSTPSPAVTAAIQGAANAQSKTPITATCSSANATKDQQKLDDCPTSLVYKFVEMTFPADAPKGSCFRKVVASGTNAGGSVGTLLTGAQWRSPMGVPISVNGLRLENMPVPVAGDVIPVKLSNVAFILDTGSNRLTSVSDIPALFPFAGISADIKPAMPAPIGNRVLLGADAIDVPVDRASLVTDAQSLKKGVAGAATNKQKLGLVAKYGSPAQAAMTLGGLSINGWEEIHLLNRRAVAFATFSLPTLVRPTDAELADPSRQKSGKELLQGISAQTVSNITATDGIVFDGLNAKVAELPAGKLFGVKDLNLSYVKSSDEWRGSMTLLFPPTQSFGAKGSFIIRGGKFVGLTASALFDPGVTLGCCVRMTEIGGGYENTYWDANNCLTNPAACSNYRAGHQNTLPPNLCLTDPKRTGCETGPQFVGKFGLAVGPTLKVGKDTKNVIGINGEARFIDATASNPWALSANADFSLLGQLPFGNASISYVNGRQFSAYGRVDKSFEAACLKLTVKGTLGIDIYSLTKWQGYIGAGVSGSLCGFYSVSFNAEALASSRGIGACATATTFWGQQFGAGAVYLWEDKALHSFSGCSHDELVKQGGVTARHALRAGTGTATQTVDVPAGRPTYLFKLTGATAPPDVVLTGPHGETVDTSTPNGARGFAVYRGTDNDTYIDALAPAAGAWTLTAKAGSSAVVGVDTASGIPTPSVTASITGRGHRRALEYEVRPIPGQQVRFVERLAGRDGAPGPAQVLGTVSDASGRLPFTPLVGPAGTRTIEATVLQRGEPRDVIKVATYVAPAPLKPSRPRLVLRRQGTTITATWTRVPGATRFRVLVRTTATDRLTGKLAGDSRFYDRPARRRTLVIKDVARATRIGVSVTGVTDSGILGATRFASRRG